jgi:hypothetical protein
MRDFDKKLDKISAIVATMSPVSVLQPALPSVTTLLSIPRQHSGHLRRLRDR